MVLLLEPLKENCDLGLAATCKHIHSVMYLMYSASDVFV